VTNDRGVTENNYQVSGLRQWLETARNVPIADNLTKIERLRKKSVRDPASGKPLNEDLPDGIVGRAR
jgi:hypothetical protein